MVTVALAVSPVALAAAAVYVARLLFAYLERRDQAHARERRELYTRIQSPELAPVIAHATSDILLDPAANQSVKFDDDEDFHEKTRED